MAAVPCRSGQLLYTSLSQCRSLTCLDLHSTESLLDSTLELPNLQHLGLDGCDHSRYLGVPPRLSGFSALQSLGLHTLTMTGHLQGLTTLSQLTSLNMWRAEDIELNWDALPGVVERLTKLCSLKVENSHFRMSACSWDRLTALTCLELKDQAIGNFGGPLTISTALTSLAVLDLTGNSLESLPSDVTCLSGLTRLELSQQKFAAAIPDDDAVDPESLIYEPRSCAGFQLDHSLLDIVCSMPNLRRLGLRQVDDHEWSETSLFYSIRMQEVLQAADSACDVDYHYVYDS